MEEASFIPKSLLMVGGMIIWAAQFTLIYSFNTLACTRQFAGVELMGVGVVPLFVMGATLAALAATTGIFLLALRRRGPARPPRNSNSTDDFMRFTTMTVAGLASVAIIWNGLPSLLVPPCG
jgi:hypothetical protein